MTAALDFDQQRAIRDAVARLPALHVGAGPEAERVRAHMEFRVRGDVLVAYMRDVHFRSLRYIFDTAPRLRYARAQWRDADLHGAAQIAARAVQRAQEEQR